MSAISHTNRLFNESGCLSIEALKRYTDSSLSENEVGLVEEHISGCPLCKDALDGVYLIHDSSHDLDSRTNFINSKLRQGFGYFPGRQKAAARRPKLRIFLIPAAASIIIMFGIISYFHYFFPENTDLAMVDTEDIPEARTEKDAATIGGIMNRDDKGIMKGVDKSDAEASAESPIDKQEIADEKPEVVEAPEEEEPNIIEEEIVLAELNEDKSIEKPEPLDKAVTITALDDMAGAGVNEEKAFAVSRSKSGKEAVAETHEMVIVSEREPSFPGGKDSLNSFLKQNISYPIAFNGSGDTTVTLQFTVNKNGKIKDISIVRGAGEEFDAEVMRVVKLMPDWIPGVRDGQNASMEYSLSVYFKLR